MSELFAWISGFKCIIIISASDDLLELHLRFQLRRILETWYRDWFVLVELLLK